MLKHVTYRPSGKRRSQTMNRENLRQHSLDDDPTEKNSSKNVISSEKIELKRPRKPRRHTTGGTKQTIEDIKLAKELNEMNKTGYITNEIDQQVDPESTLGRKQLISMLKQRYGNEIEEYRNSGVVSEKEKIRKDRQKERERRHNQRFGNEDSMPYQVEPEYAKPFSGRYNQTNGHRYGSESSGGSELSDTSIGSPNVHRARSARAPSHSRQMIRTNLSDDDLIQEREYIHSDIEMKPKQSKAVVFLQFWDEVKRVPFPANISSIDAVKVLFVNAFPGRISMPHFENGSKLIYIKDMVSGVYYHLEDYSEVVNRSFLKIHETEIHRQNGEMDHTSSVQSLDRHGHNLHRHDSANSLRSDSVLHRSALKQNIAPDTTHRHSGPTIERQVQRVHQEQQQSQTPQQRSLHGGDNRNIQVHSNELKKDNPLSPGKATSKRREPTISMAVEEQLDDLSDLLKTALKGDLTSAEIPSCDIETSECVDTKNPGKLDQSLVENLQNQSEKSKKISLPKHFKATALVKAQNEPQRPPKNRTYSSSSHSTPPQNTPPQKIRGYQDNPSKSSPMSSQAYIDGKSHHEGNFYKQQTKPEVSNIPAELPAELMDQLLELEESVKKNNSSASSVANSRRSSSSSDTSHGNIKVTSIRKVVKDDDENKRHHNSNQPNTKIHTPITNESKGNLKDISVASVSPMNTVTLPKASPQKAILSSVTDGYDQTDNAPNEPDRPVYSNNMRFSKHSSSSSSDENIPQYSKINKPKTSNTNSKTTTTFGAKMESVENDIFSNEKEDDKTSKPILGKTGKMIQPPSLTTPNFSELENSARNARIELKILRKDLADLKKFHNDNTRMFKADMQKKLLEFRKKAARLDDVIQHKLDVNNNCVFANEHPVRERRHRLTSDQLEYSKRLREIKEKIRILEGDMEATRLDVVGKKRVEEPEKLAEMHEELTALTKGLAEAKNRFHGLHDMLRNVMKSELEIIKTEEKFLLDEPDQLDELIGRCKTLSTTLFTLEKLANVQSQNQVNTLPLKAQRYKSGSHIQPEYEEVDQQHQPHRRAYSYRR